MTSQGVYYNLVHVQQKKVLDAELCVGVVNFPTNQCDLMALTVGMVSDLKHEFLSPGHFTRACFPGYSCWS